MTTTVLLTWVAAGLAAITYGALWLVNVLGPFESVRTVRRVMRGAVVALGLIALVSPAASGDGWGRFSDWRAERWDEQWREMWEDIAPATTPAPNREPSG